MDIEQARHNMLQQQVKTWDVTDPKVVEALAKTPREDYVPPSYRDLAFADMAIPLLFGQQMLAPKTEARMLQGLKLKPDETVLEIGTGSGYFTSLLAYQCQRVHTVDLYGELSGMAQHRCQQHGFYNVEYYVGDGAKGWDQAGEVDVIVITGSLPFLPEQFKQALKSNGRIMAILGEEPIMEVVVARQLHGSWQTESLFDTVIAPLEHALQPNRFTF